MTEVLSRKAIAVWLVQNTSLTFQQIADFCSMSIIDIQTIADGNYDIQEGLDPIRTSQLSRAEIKRCESNPSASLQKLDGSKYQIKPKVIKKSATPSNPSMSAAVWLLRKYKNLSNETIAKLSKLSIDMVSVIRNRGGKVKQVIARSPVSLQLCTKNDLEKHIK